MKSTIHSFRGLFRAVKLFGCFPNSFNGVFFTTKSDLLMTIIPFVFMTVAGFINLKFITSLPVINTATILQFGINSCSFLNISYLFVIIYISFFLRSKLHQFFYLLSDIDQSLQEMQVFINHREFHRQSMIWLFGIIFSQLSFVLFTKCLAVTGIIPSHPNPQMMHVNGYSMLFYTTYVVFFCRCLYAIKMRFTVINKVLKVRLLNHIKTEPFSQFSYVKKLAALHHDLNDCVELLNQTYAFPTLLSMASGFIFWVFVTFQAFHLLKDPTHLTTILITYCWCCVFLLFIYAIILLSTETFEEVSSKIGFYL